MNKVFFYFIIFIIVAFVVFLASTTKYTASVQEACEAGPYDQLADCLHVTEDIKPAFFDVILTITYMLRVAVGFALTVAVGHLMHRIIKGPRTDKKPKSKKKKRR